MDAELTLKNVYAAVVEIGRAMDFGFQRVYERLDKLEARLERVEGRLDRIEFRIGILERRAIS